MSEYDDKARAFLSRFKLSLRVKWESTACPPWDDDKHIHGDKHRVTIRKGNKRLSLPFWNSFNDRQEGKHPTEYDVLACISGEAFLPTDPDGVIEELGAMPINQAKACAKSAARLQAFFSQEELEALGEIR